MRTSSTAFASKAAIARRTPLPNHAHFARAMMAGHESKRNGGRRRRRKIARDTGEIAGPARAQEPSEKFETRARGITRRRGQRTDGTGPRSGV